VIDCIGRLGKDSDQIIVTDTEVEITQFEQHIPSISRTDSDEIIVIDCIGRLGEHTDQIIGTDTDLGIPQFARRIPSISCDICHRRHCFY
jgi:hypothetical protein